MKNEIVVRSSEDTDESVTKKFSSLSNDEIEFCRWYAGVSVDEYGGSTELDAIGSARKAGMSDAKAAKMIDRLRSDLAIQMQLAVYNRGRRGETLSRMESYARRSADVMMDIVENSDSDAVRVNAAKILMGVGGLKETDEEATFRRRQAAANDETRDRLNEIAEILGKIPVTYKPFAPSTVIIDAEVNSGSSGESFEAQEGDDDIVG
jgi:hypothetical protein